MGARAQGTSRNRDASRRDDAGPTSQGQARTMGADAPPRSGSRRRSRSRTSALTRFAEWLERTSGPAFHDYEDALAVVDRRPRGVLDLDLGVLRCPRHRGRRVRCLASRSMPGARWFEGAALNYAEVALGGRHRGRRPRDRVLPRGRRDALVVARGAHRGGRGRSGGPAPARGRARRPRRGVPADRARGGDRVPRHREHRRRVVVLLTRLRPAGRGRPVRTDRADGAARRRRLPIRRPLVRSARGARRDRGRAARCRGGADRRTATATTGLARRRRGRMARSALGPGRCPIRAGRLRAPSVDPLLLGHHRPAEVDGAGPRRHRARAPEVARAPPRPRRRRPLLLVHHHRLDDVELPGLGPAGRCHGRVVRRQSGLPGSRRPVATRRARRITYLGSSAPFIHASMQAAVEPRSVADLSTLRAIGSTGAPLSPEGFGWVDDRVGSGRLAGLDQRRDRPLHGGRDVVSMAARASRRDPVPRARREGGVVRRARTPDDRRGRRARDQRADALDARVVLERPRRRPIPRELLRRVPGRLASRGLDHDRG